MLAHCVSGVISPATHSVQRNASIHAGSTGLTGLTGIARTCECAAMRCVVKDCQVKFIGFHSRVNSTTLTLLTLIKASIHAGLKVTGFRVMTDNPCKGVV